MSYLFYRYYTLNKEINTTKHFVFDVGITDRSLVQKWRKNDKVIANYFDENYDVNYELVKTYHKGLKYEEFIDFDENGIVERFNRYAQDGSLAIIERDGDQNGMIEHLTIILENKDSIILKDKDQNGKMELVLREDQLDF